MHATQGDGNTTPNGRSKLHPNIASLNHDSHSSLRERTCLIILIAKLNLHCLHCCFVHTIHISCCHTFTRICMPVVLAQLTKASKQYINCMISRGSVKYKNRLPEISMDIDVLKLKAAGQCRRQCTCQQSKNGQKLQNVS